jgi:exodeoxyribonuclease-5
MQKFTLTKDQSTAKEFVIQQFKSSPHDENYAVCVNGYSGTGKSTLIPELVEFFGKVGDAPHLLAPTNKAVLVAARKTFAATEQRFEKGTLHSVLFGAPNEDLLWVPNDEKIYRKRVIVDESSMVDGERYEHLMDKYRNSFFVFIGDNFQLEPIGRHSPIFTQLPSTKLTEVVRYDGGILLEANNLRNVKYPVINEHKDIRFADNNHEGLENFATDLYNGEDAILIVATNQSRVAYNKAIRNALSKPERVKNDSLVCVSNTGRLSNGEIFKASGDGYMFTKKYTVKDMELEVQAYSKNGERYLIIPELPWSGVQTFDFLKNLNIAEALYLFGEDNFNPSTKKVQNVNICTWAYAMSCHKMQGSQADKIYVDFNYCAESWNPNRWLYTAITRAAKDVTLFNSKYIKRG